MEFVTPERPIKQPPYLDRVRGDAFKRRRHPENRRYMWMREDHDAHCAWDGPVNPDHIPIEDWRATTAHIKAVAREMGADLVGVCEMEDWFWARGARNPAHTRGIAFAIRMTFDELKRFGPYSQTEVHRAYYRLSDVSVRLAQYLRSYGYAACGHPNEGDVMFIPVAWKAGLGELGRHGSLITKAFGPSCRLGVVTTEMPLIADPGPQDHGFDAFCQHCNACVRFCPGEAILLEKQTVFGITRWHVDTPACRPYFEEYQGCKICLAVCPLNLQTAHGGAYKELMKRLVRKQLPLRELIDEWRREETESLPPSLGRPAPAKSIPS